MNFKNSEVLFFKSMKDQEEYERGKIEKGGRRSGGGGGGKENFEI